MLDVYELCTGELQEKMLTIRSRFKEVEDKKLEKQQQKVPPFNLHSSFAEKSISFKHLSRRRCRGQTEPRR